MPGWDWHCIYRCRVCPGEVILPSLRHRTLHEGWHHGGFVCSVDGCGEVCSSEYARRCHERWHTTGKPFPCRLGWPDRWFRLASQQCDHHKDDHGVAFMNVAKEHGRHPASTPARSWCP